MAKLHTVGIWGGVGITAGLLAFPDAALQIWLSLPAEIKGVIPEDYVPFIGAVLTALSLGSKLLRKKGSK